MWLYIYYSNRRLGAYLARGASLDEWSSQHCQRVGKMVEVKRLFRFKIVHIQHQRQPNTQQSLDRNART